MACISTLLEDVWIHMFYYVSHLSSLLKMTWSKLCVLIFFIIIITCTRLVYNHQAFYWLYIDPTHHLHCAIVVSVALHYTFCTIMMWCIITFKLMSPHISLLYQSIQKVTHSKFKCFKFFVDILIPVLFIFQSINIFMFSK